MLITQIQNIQNQFNETLQTKQNLDSLEQIRINFLGKKGLITNIFTQLKNLDDEQKKVVGLKINEVKNHITTSLENLKNELLQEQINQKLATEKLDLTAPALPKNVGAMHPISKTILEIKQIFTNLGFIFAEGPELEDDFHNFTALNMAENHPARQMQDTFYLKNSPLLLRTHTSNTQIRYMKNHQPPFKICSLGRVFRKDSDPTHTPMFHQVEGFVVDKNINMGHLKWVLETFLAIFFNTNNLQLRFRPSFFPFTEPSAEVDINYSMQQGRIKAGLGDKFMEILGCGMIHPNVLQNCGHDPSNLQGFAFGIGIERLAMLKYGITDLRWLFDSDLPFLQHYSFKLHQIG